MKNNLPYFLLLFVLLASPKTIVGQKEYLFASTGLQKLLLNPALAGNSRGLQIQTLGAKGFYSASYFLQGYAGVDYGFKNAGLGLSYTSFYQDWNSFSYSSQQADLSFSYKLHLPA